MEGRTIVRPGAGDRQAGARRTVASMEGRTIVRPGARRVPGLLAAVRASMEGRTIVRPGAEKLGAPVLPIRASMEGRTIVRPGSPVAGAFRSRSQCFNGGPDNCPARHDGLACPVHVPDLLQWRAGQLSGQAGNRIRHPPPPPKLQWRAGQLSGQADVRHRTGPRPRTASMEGRTIVRPGSARSRATFWVRSRFNGGPDNCPARRRRYQASERGPYGFNGGPDNCPARQSGVYRHPVRHRRFNGGPDNCPARPDEWVGGVVGYRELQWRAGQLSGQASFTAPRRAVAKALQWRAGQLSGQARSELAAPRAARPASMEGRTIVRPGDAMIPC